MRGWCIREIIDGLPRGFARRVKLPVEISAPRDVCIAQRAYIRPLVQFFGLLLLLLLRLGSQVAIGFVPRLQPDCLLTQLNRRHLKRGAFLRESFFGYL